MIARRISLFTGLYLFAFLFAHLINLSLGLQSVEAMDSARAWLIAPWTNRLGGGLLLVSLCFHILMGMRALYFRNTLRLGRFDAFQLLLGLSIPLLLFPHIITMSMLPVLTDQHATYRQVLGLFWIDNLLLGLRQVVGLMVVWLHSCMGLFVWMRLQQWWGKVSLFVYPTVVLLPTLALLGFVEAGKEVIASSEVPPQSAVQSRTTEAGDGLNKTGSTNSTARGNYVFYQSDSAEEVANPDQDSEAGKSSANVASGDGADSQGSVSDRGVNPMQKVGRAVQITVVGYLFLLAVVLTLRAWRLSRTRTLSNVRFGATAEFTVTSGASLLEVSRLNDVAHASLCGGKGRCGTCQVAVLSGMENLSPLTEIENRKLRQIDASEHVRLACQARVMGGSVELEPLLPAYVVADDMPHRQKKNGTTADAVMAASVAIADGQPESHGGD